MHDGHAHTHTASLADGGAGKAETLAMLQFMLAHNQHHAAELDELSAQLAALGLNGQAHELLHCKQAYEQANDRLEKLLATI